MDARKQKKGVLFLVICCVLTTVGLGNENRMESGAKMALLEVDSVYHSAQSNFRNYTLEIYNQLGDSTLNFDAFEQALIGYHNLDKAAQLERKEILTLIDFSKPSSEERLYIIDLCKFKIKHRSIVAHGVNSGRLYAKEFSNENNSRKSSLGFYVTTTTYKGKFDLALRLKGLEYSNSHAGSRGVVMHAAKYATYEFLERNGGTLGRSYGCPAMPFEHFHQVVDWIKGGTCLYIYYPSRSYRRYSKYLNKKQYLEDFIWV